MRPAVCFFENVEGHISLGLPDVIEDLAGLGYTTTWGIFSASEVGASHQRKRVFILAYRHGERGQLPDWWRVAAEQMPVGYGETWRDELMANAVCERRQQDARGASCHEEANGREGWDVQQQDGYYVAASHVQGTAWPSRPGEHQFAWEPPRVVVDSKRAERRQDNYERSEQSAQETDRVAACGEELGNAAHTNRRSRVSAEEAGAGPEDIWRRRSGESSERQTESPLGRDADGSADWLDDAELFTTCDNRTDELRLLGNGVVPATAERAFRVLVGELIQHANP